MAYPHSEILFGKNMNDVLIHIMTLMNLENVMLSEGRQSQKTTYGMISFSSPL